MIQSSLSQLLIGVIGAICGCLLVLAPANSGDVFTFVAKRVSELPIWIFHGDADRSVDVEVSRKMTAALKSVGARVQYTEFPGVDHNGATNTAYARAELIEWMLRQRRR